MFIDEVDAFGDRAAYGDQNRDYSVQVLNAMLELLDGAQSREGVVVVAAANRPDAIDPALLRPGRLDRIVAIGLPNTEALIGILRHHLGDDLKEVDVSWLARACVGLSGAHVEQAVRGMRRRARRADRRPTLADLEGTPDEGFLLPNCCRFQTCPPPCSSPWRSTAISAWAPRPRR
ncbi:AAA family ATPase [Falsiroseomonas sp. E2-1-a20]|uniref:AAA family ATPase n=1 Tax=Falsiroseomonas sp. E2-1-a20 TaxID=3239300 RepID=UPI003F3FC4F9